MRGFQQGGITVRQALRLARGERVRITVPVPIAAANENIRFEIREDGKTLERFNYTGFQSGTPAANASALIVADPSSPFALASAGWARDDGRARPAGMSPASRLLDFVLEPSRLPDQLARLHLAARGRHRPEGVGAAERAAEGRAPDVDRVRRGPVLRRRQLAALFPGRPALAAAHDRAVAAYFFGRIHLPSSGAITAGRTREDADRHATSLQDCELGAAGEPRGATGARSPRAGSGCRFPASDGVPARAYLSILIVFTLLIGPVNYWVLWRKRRQVLLVLTAPVISAVFILLLAGYVLAGEGLGVRGRAVTFTMLDQVAEAGGHARRALSLYAAGMTPGGGLRVRARRRRLRDRTRRHGQPRTADTGSHRRAAL